MKVLTPGDEQKINVPPGHQFEPPRLGQVGAAELYVNRRLEFGKSVAEPEAVGKIADFEREREVLDPHPLASADTRVLDMLRSLRSGCVVDRRPSRTNLYRDNVKAIDSG